jgi:hypothetical protein
VVSARTRRKISVAVPARKGTIRVTGLVGKSAAMAGKEKIHKRVIAPSNTILLFIIFTIPFIIFLLSFNG